MPDFEIDALVWIAHLDPEFRLAVEVDPEELRQWANVLVSETQGDWHESSGRLAARLEESGRCCRCGCSDMHHEHTSTTGGMMDRGACFNCDDCEAYAEVDWPAMVQDPEGDRQGAGAASQPRGSD